MPSQGWMLSNFFFSAWHCQMAFSIVAISSRPGATWEMHFCLPDAHGFIAPGYHGFINVPETDPLTDQKRQLWVSSVGRESISSPNYTLPIKKNAMVHSHKTQNYKNELWKKLQWNTRYPLKPKHNFEARRFGAIRMLHAGANQVWCKCCMQEINISSKLLTVIDSFNNRSSWFAYY